MSPNQSSDTTDAQTTNTQPSSQYDVTMDRLQRPGCLFDVDGHLFLTTGGPDGVNVIRVETTGRETLDPALLAEDIENGDLHITGTHSKHTEAAVNRTALATLIDYVADDVDRMPGDVPSDVKDAAEEARAALE